MALVSIVILKWKYRSALLQMIDSYILVYLHAKLITSFHYEIKTQLIVVRNVRYCFSATLNKVILPEWFIFSHILMDSTSNTCCYIYHLPM